jgi:hypothetical protein
MQWTVNADCLAWKQFERIYADNVEQDYVEECTSAVHTLSAMN